jgi:hypothetical protein
MQKKEGFKIVEAYPNKRAEGDFENYHGSYGMYIKNGFIEDKTTNKTILRKYL